MKRLIFLGILFIVSGYPSVAQQKKASLVLNGKFYDMSYKIHKTKAKAREVLKRDFVTFHIETRTSRDSVLKSTFQKKPLIKEISIEDYRYADKGFMEEMLMKLKVGDSATFWVNSNMLFDAIKRPRPPFIAPGENVKYIFKILEVKNAQELENAKKDVIFKQRKADQKKIVPYATKNLTDPKKTYSGIWYHIEAQGEGDFALKNDVVAISYVGKFLDGTVFGSSARDGRLFEFPVGGNFAIKGLDEVMLLLKKGAKGTFIFPSYLAYGTTGWGDKVPPNTPLVFEIEFVDIISRKIVIENKGEIKQEEETKEKNNSLIREDKLKQIEKDLKKRENKGEISGHNR